MEQEIKYLGHTASPSDYECQDGELSVSMDLWPENGALKPVLQPKMMFDCDGGTVMCVHETSAFRHYVLISKTGTLSYVDAETTTDVKQITTTANEYTLQNVMQITCIGNTLVVLTENGMEYFLWSENEYILLGTKIPELNLSFGLQGKVVRSDSFDISFDAIQVQHFAAPFSDSNEQKITDQVLAQVNKFIAEESLSKGKFLYSFFVRYAYRLFDGSLTRHSAPIFMMCNMCETAPRVHDNNPSEGKDPKQQITSATLRIVGVVHDLDYAALDSAETDMLEKWGDIVQSVDIFISSPIYTYDQNGTCTRYQSRSIKECYTVCKHTNQSSESDASKYPLRYQVNTYAHLYKNTFPNERLSDSWIKLPSKDEDTVYDDIKSCFQFYFLKSIKLNEISTERKVIDVPADYLDSLVSREAMTDDYDSHDEIIPRYAFVYNQRLNLANLKKKLFDGFPAASMIAYTDGYINYSASNPVNDDSHKFTVEFFVHIKQDGKNIVVKGGSGEFVHLMPAMLFYYPNINAYKITARYNDTKDYWYDISLEKHGFLNGSFYFGQWNGSSINTSGADGTQISTSSDLQRMIDISNKIYTSEVNNPFSFPVLGINTVGTGKILGISTAAKALSQGQFGQFPLYAFTTDGIWALEVSAEGTYSARQPITRDVCINTDSITQIDNAVLFATERGIMLISGSETQCISTMIDNRNDEVFDILDMKGSVSLVSESDKESFGFVPFRTFLSDCRMLYDDTSRRIIVFNPSYRYAYIYSMDAKRWGMMRSRITRALNSYPEALAMTTSGHLEDYSKRMPNAAVDGASTLTQVLMTRPFKLGYPDVLKTIDTVIQRGNFKRGNIKSVLYGSRDLANWFPVYSSTDHYLRGFRGTPYKYFRLALKCSMTDKESLSGATIRFEPKFTNQNR